jgi:drug/metabolite transporter (DMT)-like permease
MFIMSMAITVLANVLYHVAQRSVPGGVHPLASLFANYTVALLITAALVPFYPGRESLQGSFRLLNWASVAVGIAIVGVEIGFLLAYRAGWNVSLAAVTSGATLAVLLLPVGVLFFRERVSVTNILGVALCIGGLLLVARK